MKDKAIILVAGGTGGHVFPMLALYEVLAERGYRVECMTDKRGERFFSGTNVFPNIVASSLMPKDLKGRLRAGFQIIRGIIQSMEMYRQYGAGVVVGFGGYPSFPPLFAAQFLQIPTVLHEQNAIFGRANRQLAQKAKMIATSFVETRGLNLQHQSKVIHTGNPVRKIMTGDVREYHLPRKGEPFKLLVIGGSQGSAIFSQVIPAAVELLPAELRQSLVVTQQARAEDIKSVMLTYNKIAVSARIEPFFKDIHQLYSDAHLIVARSGSSTVFEITALGRPALFVPLAVSLDGDQAENAQQLVKRNAAWILEEKGFTPEALAARLTELMTSPGRLMMAAKAAHELGMRDAAEKLADIVVNAMR